MLRAETVTLPAHWASLLINGDSSGLDEGEAERIAAYLAEAYPGHAFVSTVDDDEGRFTWSLPLYDGGLSGCQGGTVLDYVALVRAD